MTPPAVTCIILTVPINRKLLQTRVPDEAHAEVERLAAVAGVSAATWLRQAVLKAIGMNGLGQKVKK